MSTLAFIYFYFRFYVNLQIMNNQCFDTLAYIRGTPLQEKQTLFEYLFNSMFFK